MKLEVRNHEVRSSNELLGLPYKKYLLKLREDNTVLRSYY